MSWTPISVEQPRRQWVWFGNHLRRDSKPIWVAQPTPGRWTKLGWTHWHPVEPPTDQPTEVLPELPAGHTWGERDGLPAILDDRGRLAYWTDGVVVGGERNLDPPLWAIDALRVANGL